MEKTEVSFLDLISLKKLDRWKDKAKRVGAIKIIVFYNDKDKIYFPYWFNKGDDERLVKTPDEENEYVGEIEL